MININEIQKSDIEFADEIFKLALEARSFLKSHKWCKKIDNIFLDRGWGYILAVFYCEFQPNGESVDNSVWIIVGDIPPAYIDIESAKNGYDAIRCYVNIMEDWVEHVKENKSVNNCYPINVAANIENAEMLETRLKLIVEEILA